MESSCNVNVCLCHLRYQGTNHHVTYENVPLRLNHLNVRRTEVIVPGYAKVGVFILLSATENHSPAAAYGLLSAHVY